jgi:acyl-coenzyme A thioesterase PaaI-like protein
MLDMGDRYPAFTRLGQAGRVDHLTRAQRALDVPLASALGLRLLDEADPAAGCRLEVAGLVDNGAGAAHASALGAALELAGYLAVAPTLADDEHAVTVMSSVTLVGAARAGERVEVRARLDRRTRRLAFLGAVATVDGATVARATLTKSVVSA